MKNDVRSQDRDSKPTLSDSRTTLTRIQLACLDSFANERRGYDPYDTSRGLSDDIWSRKRKRA